MAYVNQLCQPVRTLAELQPIELYPTQHRPKHRWPFQSVASVIVVYLSVSSNSAIAHLPFNKPLGYLSHRGSPNQDIFLMPANSLFPAPTAELAETKQTDNLLRQRPSQVSGCVIQGWNSARGIQPSILFHSIRIHLEGQRGVTIHTPPDL